MAVITALRKLRHENKFKLREGEKRREAGKTGEKG